MLLATDIEDIKTHLAADTGRPRHPKKHGQMERQP
jgi:hypothetical protein